MGHSLGEYGALVAAGALTFDAALEAVSARGREMASLSMDDNGAMAAVFAPLAEIERIVAAIDGYVVLANINSTSQAVIGGATDAVERAVAAFQAAGINAVPSRSATPSTPRSWRRRASRCGRCCAGSTCSAPAADRRQRHRRLLPGRRRRRARCSTCSAARSPRRCSSSDGLHTLYDAGARVFVEVGPKKALHGFVEDVLGEPTTYSRCSPTTPRSATSPSFNQALCGL